MDNWLATAEPFLDRNLRLEYLARKALDMNMRDQIFERMVANKSYPSYLMDLSAEVEKYYLSVAKVVPESEVDFWP